MSVILADLANLPDVDLCIDPTTTFSPATNDTLLYHDSPSIYGSTGLVYWGEDDHLVFGFDVDAATSEMSTGIISATLEIYAEYSTMEAGIEARAHRVTTSWSEGTANWYDPWIVDGGDFNNPAFEGPPVTLPTSDSRWLKLNVTSILKMQYATGGASDVKNKGFLVKMEDPANGDLGICFSEHGTSGYRPKLVVTYSMPTFGADAGYAWDVAWDPEINDFVPWPMTDRQKNMKADRLYCIRHFGGGAQSDDFVQHAYENGMKVAYLVGSGTPAGAAAYAASVTAALNAVDDYIDGPYAGTVIAVELGNEEDVNFETVGYLGGQQFGEYYVAARNAVKQNWPNLEIVSGGSISNHRDFQKWDMANPGGGLTFFQGFIDSVTQAAQTAGKGRYDYLPDTVAIHGYQGAYSPEDKVTTDNPLYGGPLTEWKFRVACLVESCTERGWFPNVSVTEYGYSPIPGNSRAPTSGASQTSQAVYYLRTCLMNGTMRIPGANWKYSMYFHHPRDEYELGFHATDNFPGSSRAIRYIAREIGCATGNSPGLCAPGSTIWSPLRTREEGSYTYSAWCGWKREDGQLVGAIWQYGHEPTYFQPTPTARAFIVEGNYNGIDAYLYEFEISDGAASFQSAGDPVSGIYNSGTGETTWTIPGVYENPIFLLIDN